MKTLLLTILVLGLEATLQAQDPLSFRPEQQNVRLGGRGAGGKGRRKAANLAAGSSRNLLQEVPLSLGGDSGLPAWMCRFRGFFGFTSRHAPPREQSWEGEQAWVRVSVKVTL